jgi:zinc transporter ZupT
VVPASRTIAGATLSVILAHKILKTQIAFLISCAAGMMMGCAFVLLEESFRLRSAAVGMVSLCVGISLMKCLDMICTRYLNVDFEFVNLHGKKAVRLLILVLGLILHSLGEGLSLGLSAVTHNGEIVYTS